MYVTIYATIARWFDKRRGAAMSFLSVGFGTGALIGPPIMDFFLQRLVWQSVFLLLSVPIGVTFSLAVVFFRADPASMKNSNMPNLSKNSVSQPGEKLTIGDVFMSRKYWFLSVGLLLSNYGFFVVIVHFIPYATSVGISGTVAAGTLGLIGGASIPSRFGAGLASDYVGILPVLTGSIGLMSLSLFGIVAIADESILVLFVVIFGVGFGGLNGLYSPFIAEIFTISNVGRMIGLTGISFAVAGSTGPAVSSLLYQVTGSYDASFSLAGILGITGATLIVLSTRF